MPDTKKITALYKEARTIAITDPERAYEILQQVKEEQKRTGEICICGHSAKAHVDMGDGKHASCFPGRMRCDCKEVRAVLRVSNARPFLRKTEGPSSWHALGAGMINLEKAGGTVEWIVPKVCDRCGSNDGVIVAAINPKTGIVESHTTGVDKLICRTCYADLGATEGLE